MVNGRAYDRRATYEIVVQGRLDESWSEWFAGFHCTAVGDDATRLRGQAADQGALHALLNRIGELGLVLLSLRRVEDSG